jgi:predicted nucleic acid-binding protein
MLDADDSDHACAVRVAREIASERRPSFITNYIEAEAHALLVRKLGRMIARQWLLTGGLPVAISFAVLDARRVTRAFTFDHHFQQYGRIKVLGLGQ